MSKKVAPLAHRGANELQAILGLMEIGDYLASLNACARVESVVVQMRMELLGCMEQQHRDEIKAHQKEIDEIKKMMPFQGRGK